MSSKSQITTKSSNTHFHNTLRGAGSLALALVIGCNLSAMASTVGFWQLEGTPGTSASGANSVLDSSGNGLNATPGGIPLPTYSSDVSPAAAALGSTSSMFFSGSGSKLFVPDSAAFQLTSSLTIQAWIKPEPLVAGTGMQGNILFRGDNRPGLDPYFLYVSSAGMLTFGINNATTGVAISSAIPWDQWMHVAATLDGSTGAMDLYVNGVLVKSTTTSIRPLAQLDPNYEPGVGIGCDQDNQYAELYHGWLDDVRLSDAALLPAQFDIPEPSSMALVALGAAALAFSRKQAKR